MKYRYAYCKLKNIALSGNISDDGVEVIGSHIDLVDHLPDNCIRIKSISNWCKGYCRECYDIYPFQKEI